MPSSPRRARRFGASLLVSLLLLGAPPAFAGAAAPRVDLRALATAKSFDRFIVKFRDGSTPAASPATVDAVLARAADRAKAQWAAGLRAHGQPAPRQPWTLRSLRRLAVGADVFRASEKLDHARTRLLLEQLAADPQVEYVAIDQVLHEALTPNDTSYSQLWGLQDADAGIRADKAWDLGNGAGAVVAVIDTGYTDHSDLAANILPGYDFVADVTRANDGNGRDADAHDPGNWTASSNSNWHGTHVAGTVAAVANNAKGVAGGAYGAKVVPVRVLGVGGGDGSDIADGITWASGGSVPGVPANPNPAEVLNLSLGGGGGCAAIYQAAIDGAVSRGALVVVSAGNDNLDVAGGSLSTCNNVVVVGAHTSTSARSSFSNYGTGVDVSAPGSTILSTINTGTTVPVAEGYANYQGTSMAAPHVSAAAALAQAYRVAKGLPPYTPAQLEAQMKATAYPMAQGCSVSSGNIVDARTLLDTADNAFKLLASGVAQSNQAATTGNGLRYAMVTTTTAQGLSFSSSGGSGNADLYVRFGSAPTTSVYDCRSNVAGNGESCVIPVAQAGTYYVLLQAASSYSGVSLTGTASGNLKPVAAFTVGGSGLTANFTDGSSDADGGVASRSWKFGDGSTSTSASPSHAYSLAGGYTVEFKATDGAGASNCVLKQVNVNPANQALSNGVTVSNIASNQGGQLPYSLVVPAGASNLHFNTAGGAGDADLYVKFGSPPTLSDFDCVSGSPNTIESCALASATPGTWYVMVHAFSSISGVGLTGSFDAGPANSPPVANFSFTTSNLTANFTDASTDSDGTIASRSWNFGDGSTSTATNPSHTYASGGTYTVQLTVTDDDGANHATSKQVTVSAAPSVSVSVLDASIVEGDANTRTLSFTVKLSAAAAGAVTYDIATANGSATAGSDYVAKSLTKASIPAGNLQKLFSVTINGDTAVEPDETFTVNLSNVTGASVADGQGMGTITNDDAGPPVNAPPVADFSFTTSDLTANFTDASSDIDGTIASRSWNFGDGSTSTATNPSHTYATGGTYTVQLTVTDDDGAPTSISKPVTVSAASGVAISVLDASIVEGNATTRTLTFTVKLSAAAAEAVVYDIATANGSATAGSDYAAKALKRVSIPAGSVQKTFSVTINSDTAIEPDETFTVNLSNVTGAGVSDAQAVGTIQNDD